MRVCAAQFQTKSADLTYNLSQYKRLIQCAADKNIDLIFFPELSLTGYEPEQAEELAMTEDDHRFSIFQTLSDQHGMIIGISAPIRSDHSITISLLFFIPDKETLLYSKQILHNDEKPFFQPGTEQLLIPSGKEVLAPAICYESLQDEHQISAKQSGASIYLASIAKHNAGMSKAYQHYARIARQSDLIVIMANSVGPCDNFIAGGLSAIWLNSGQRLTSLAADVTGIAGIDTVSHEAISVTL
ncbi:carbon-nitrogen hydrolase family protein [Oceanospirillum sediminis]|uniref:Carbon-nitrogen hydrolase family protein n=1 Tax=Oceanospirillum sediminis TaxID=2760088 RepID=A0A839IQA2_9GAMM|nr:carbon-nitrogen hydrolase family protein [Oceanospirillum sediminis]MBB1486854.1 carbon-nitrogen hydrolase family protein [Oceanospirillum sediminis]